MIHVGIASGGTQALDMSPWRSEVWVAPTVATARPVGDNETINGCLDAGDGDDEGIVGRGVEAIGVGSVVASGSDDHNACIPRSFDSGGQRIGVIRPIGVAVERQVEHPNVQFVGVIDYPIDAGHEARQGHVPATAGDLD